MFYVGQRVRVVRPIHPENMGITGTIYAAGPFRKFELFDGSVFPEDCDCLVAFDGDPKPGCCSYWQIEPILPPGLESLEEINALYEPSSVEVRA